MTRLIYLLGFIGMLLIPVLAWKAGLAELAEIFRQAGWGLLLLVPLHVLPMMCDTYSWRILLRDVDGPPRQCGFPFLFWICSVREAFGLLPLTSLAGDVAGIRIMRTRVSNGAGVIGSVVVEAFLTLCNQYVIALASLIILLAKFGTGATAADVVLYVALGLMPALPLLFVLASSLRSRQFFGRLETLASRFIGRRLASYLQGVEVDNAIHEQFGHRGRMLLAMLFELLGYLFAALGTWVALQLLGHPLGFVEIFALEAIVIIIRQVLILVPAGIGIQEAAILGMGTFLGLPTEIAVALSLVKRAREVLYSLPMLLSWQWFEWKQLKALPVDRRRATSDSVVGAQ